MVRTYDATMTMTMTIDNYCIRTNQINRLGDNSGDLCLELRDPWAHEEGDRVFT